MNKIYIILVFVSLLKYSFESCKEVEVQQNINLKEFASKKWFIQKQAITYYLPQTWNFCVSAEYQVLPKKTFWGYDIQVHNIAYEQNSKIHDSGSFICAQIDPKENAKLSVGPCFLPRIKSWTTGAYWIVSYDESEGYALVSGGQPTIETPNGCRTGSGINDSGLWIFTREQQRNEQLVAKVQNIAKEKGFDISVLNDVQQSGCP